MLKQKKTCSTFLLSPRGTVSQGQAGGDQGKLMRDGSDVNY